MDVDEQTEVIRVPKHNNVDALELMNDFIAVCYKSIHYQMKVFNHLQSIFAWWILPFLRSY